MSWRFVFPLLALALPAVAQDAAPGKQRAADFQVPRLWEYTAPLIAPEPRGKESSVAQKDPSIVFHGGQWHVFMTIKTPGQTAIEHCAFAEWDKAHTAKRTILKLTDSKYFGAPQVFFFTPHKKWYLVYQVGMPDTKKMWVAYSTTDDIARPDTWTEARPMLDGGDNDPRVEGGLDYWIICDQAKAYLFLTNLNGKLWRLSTSLRDFPRGFDHCELALSGKFFEASHTYKLKGTNKYLTIIEEDGQRYYKAWLADRLDGPWTAVADSPERPFASWINIRPTKGVEPWTDNVSHGELVRDGNDETMTVDPTRLRFVFQGLREQDKAGKGYGQFPWRIGILTPIVD